MVDPPRGSLPPHSVPRVVTLEGRAVSVSGIAAVLPIDNTLNCNEICWRCVLQCKGLAFGETGGANIRLSPKNGREKAPCKNGIRVLEGDFT